MTTQITVNHLQNLSAVAMTTMVVVLMTASALRVAAEEPAPGVGPGESAGGGSLQPAKLHCELAFDPLNIVTRQPRLGWACVSTQRGAVQPAYQVVVEGMWDSGKVASDHSRDIVYDGKPLASMTTYRWRVRLWDRDQRPSAWSPWATWTTAFLDEADWLEAEWIYPPNKFDASLPAVSLQEPKLAVGGCSAAFSKSFELEAVPSKALICVNPQMKRYELYINGAKVGDDVLSPARSNAKQTYYLQYDVAALLRKGRNVIGVWAEDAVAVRVQMRAEVDGRTVIVCSDRTWTVRAIPQRHLGGAWWNNFGGEYVDARVANLVADWLRTDAGSQDDPKVWSSGKDGLKQQPHIAQDSPVYHVSGRIAPTAITPLGEGRYEIDFGTCLTGWLELKMPALADKAVVRLYFAESVRGPARPAQQRYDRTFPTADGGNRIYRLFGQRSVFVSDGKAGGVYRERFNYHGFRYVIVEGLSAAPTPTDVAALRVTMKTDEVGAFACSDDLLNRIHAVNRYTLQSINIDGIMSDCPHRERGGYGGDSQLSLVGNMMNFHLPRFYAKWTRDWRGTQTEDGSMPNVAPNCVGGGGGPAWPGSCAAIAWQHYLQYGSKRILEENYETVRRYNAYLDGKADAQDILRNYGKLFDCLFSWLAPQVEKVGPGDVTSRELGNNCYRIYLYQVQRNMAQVLGRDDEVTRCDSRIAALRAAVHKAFYDPEQKRYAQDFPDHYVMPLVTGVVPEDARAAVLANFVEHIVTTSKGHLGTSMLGTVFMQDYLSRIGRDDLLLGMYQKTTYPSWGHMLTQGATTWWEDWEGGSEGTSIHSSFTSADNWLYQGLAGIRPDPAAPGFRNTIIKPAVVGDLTWVKAHHDSLRGRIVSQWTRQTNQLVMEVTIPANSTATVYVPAAQAGEVRESGKAAAQAQGVTFLRHENGAAVFAVASGSYRFETSLPTPGADTGPGQPLLKKSPSANPNAAGEKK
jgi:alpha-L-rhamnosidase